MEMFEDIYFVYTLRTVLFAVTCKGIEKVYKLVKQV